MIDISDLRGGNYIIHNVSGAVATILKIEKNQVLLETFPQSSYCSDTDISGIELTTEMLQNLFFANDEDVSKWTGHGINLYLKPDGFFYGLRISKSRAKIQYLHQLQNYIADFYETFREQPYSLDVSMLYSNA